MKSFVLVSCIAVSLAGCASSISMETRVRGLIANSVEARLAWKRCALTTAKRMLHTDTAPDVIADAAIFSCRSAEDVFAEKVEYSPGIVKFEREDTWSLVVEAVSRWHAAGR